MCLRYNIGYYWLANYIKDSTGYLYFWLGHNISISTSVGVYISKLYGLVGMAMGVTAHLVQKYSFECWGSIQGTVKCTLCIQCMLWFQSKMLTSPNWGRKSCPFWGRNMLPLLQDKQITLIGGHKTNRLPFFEGTNRLPFWGDKLVAIIREHTNGLPFLRDKQNGLIRGQTGCSFWRTDRLPFLRDKQATFYEGQIGCLFSYTIILVEFLTYKSTSPNWQNWRRKVTLFGGETGCHYWGTNR